MTFANYSSANKAAATLAAGINGSAVSVVLTTGQGDLFPTSFPFMAALIGYDGQRRIARMEIVKVTGGTDDTFSIVRSAGFCPADYQATMQTNTAFSFSSGDTFTNVLTAEEMADLKAEVTRKV